MTEALGPTRHFKLNTLFPWGPLWRQGPTFRAILLVAIIDAMAAALFAGSITILLLRTTTMELPAIGIALSIGGSASVLAAVPLGRLVDWIGPRSYLVGASLVAAAAFFLYPFARNVITVAAVAAVANSAVAASWPALQSLIGATTEEQERSVLLGGVRSARNAGYALAGILLGIVLSIPAQRGIWVVAGIPCVTYLVSAVVYASQPDVARVNNDRMPGEALIRPWKDRRYIALTVVSTIFALSMTILDIGFPLWIVHSDLLPDYMAGYILVANTVLVILFQVKAAEVTSTLSRARLSIAWASFGFVLAFVLMAASGRVEVDALAVALVAIAAVSFSIGELLESAAWWTVSFELAPPPRRNEYLALFSLNYQVVGAVGPLVVTSALALGSRGWWIFAGLMLFAGALGTALLRIVDTNVART